MGIYPGRKNKKMTALVILGGGLWQDATGHWRTVDLGEGGDLFLGFNDRWRVLAGALSFQQDPSLVIIASGGKGILRHHPTAPPVATVMRQELEELGVPPAQIIEEYGDNTYSELAGLPIVLRGVGLTAVTIVTNEWHLPRVEAMYQHLIPRSAYEGIAVSFSSAESILLALAPDEWQDKVEVARHDPNICTLRVQELQGVEDIKAGRYHLPVERRFDLEN